VSPGPFPRRGEVWLADLDPTRGHEQAGQRPVLVASVDPFNRSPLGLVIVVPLTTRSKGSPSHIPVTPPEGGLRAPSWVLCEALRSVSTERMVARWGAVTDATLGRVEVCLRLLLGL
jgi:mRNA interferase MazF